MSMLRPDEITRAVDSLRKDIGKTRKERISGTKEYSVKARKYDDTGVPSAHPDSEYDRFDDGYVGTNNDGMVFGSGPLLGRTTPHHV